MLAIASSPRQAIASKFVTEVTLSDLLQRVIAQAPHSSSTGSSGSIIAKKIGTSV